MGWKIMSKAKSKKTKKQKPEIEKVKIPEEIALDKKPEEKENVEIRNLEIEIKESMERCIKCGMCKSLCPVFKAMREEYYSPRGKAMIMSEKIMDKILFQCTLCGACEKKCPLKIKVWEGVRKSRELMVLRGKELEENKEMIKNIRETGSPFGKDPDKDGKLYCC